MRTRDKLYVVLASVVVFAFVNGEAQGSQINIGLRPVLSPGVEIVTEGSETEPYEIRVLPGTEFQLQMFFDAKGLPVFGSLYAFNVDVPWHPGLDLDGVGPGDWSAPGDFFKSNPSPTDRVPGPSLAKVETDALSFFAPKGTENLLATLLVHCNGPGLTELVPVLRDADSPGPITASLYIRNPGGQPIPIPKSNVGGTAIFINQVPIPASVLLLGSGLVGLLGFRRKIFRK